MKNLKKIKKIIKKVKKTLYDKIYGDGSVTPGFGGYGKHSISKYVADLAGTRKCKTFNA